MTGEGMTTHAMLYRDYLEAGYKIFGLHGVDAAGHCGCGDPRCKTLYKHPVASNWQHTPHWSDEQLEVMEATGQLSTGYGVLVDGLLVIDIDARNGGVQSHQKLLEAVPEVAGAGLVVATGSGGGSKHLYFALPDPTPLMQSHPDFPGIDFKSSGYVVGPGSLHASGNRYQAVHGTPYDIERAPDALLSLLRKPERYRAGDGRGSMIDYTLAELRELVLAIPNNESTDYEVYIRVGMGIHHATGGTPEGFALWEEWAARGPRYAQGGPSRIEARWHSFGKSASPVTLGTLIHYATQAGWRPPVTFAPDWTPPPSEVDPLDTTGVDLLRPPGFVGQVAEWINSQSLFPRESLAVAAALMVVSNCGGMRYSDPLDHSSFNLFCFGVADSSSGKEAILQAHNELLRAAGISGALVGGIKSEQEIYRNLIRHQAAFYSIDELGEHLAKITNSRNRGGAVYLEGVVGTLMSLYSKSNSFAPVTGDLKEDIRHRLLAEQKALAKAVDEGADADAERRLERVERQLRIVDLGLENPFLSIFGVTTPEKFNALMDYEMAVNGFMGRALIFRELERNPRIKPRDKRHKTPVPDFIRYALCNLYAPGYSIEEGARVERIGEKTEIQTEDAAAAALDAVGDAFWEMAERHKEETGLHPIPRRGYELVAKVSGILAMPSGLRTIEHVRWAYALVRRDIEGKMRIAYSNSAEDSSSALCSKILSILSTEHGESLRTLQRQCRGYRSEDVAKALELLEQRGVVVRRESTGRGRPTVKFFAVEG